MHINKLNVSVSTQTTITLNALFKLHMCHVKTKYVDREVFDNISSVMTLLV